MEIERDILMHFLEDRLLRTLYCDLPYSKGTLRRVFNSLETLGYLARTNPRAGKAATFCTTRRGRELLTSQYGVDLEQLLLF